MEVFRLTDRSYENTAVVCACVAPQWAYLTVCRLEHPSVLIEESKLMKAEQFKRRSTVQGSCSSNIYTSNASNVNQ